MFPHRRLLVSFHLIPLLCFHIIFTHSSSPFLIAISSSSFLSSQWILCRYACSHLFSAGFLLPCLFCGFFSTISHRKVLHNSAFLSQNCFLRLFVMVALSFFLCLYPFFAVSWSPWNPQSPLELSIHGSPMDVVHVFWTVPYPLIWQSIPHIWVFFHSLICTSIFSIFHCFQKSRVWVISQLTWTSCFNFTFSFKSYPHSPRAGIWNPCVRKRHMKPTSLFPSKNTIIFSSMFTFLNSSQLYRVRRASCMDFNDDFAMGLLTISFRATQL